jgi:hypothetical protein
MKKSGKSAVILTKPDGRIKWNVGQHEMRHHAGNRRRYPSVVKMIDDRREIRWGMGKWRGGRVAELAAAAAAAAAAELG